jgi:predicted kinase
VVSKRFTDCPSGKHHFLPVAIVFDLSERLCQDRNRDRPAATSARM